MPNSLKIDNYKTGSSNLLYRKITLSVSVQFQPLKAAQKSLAEGDFWLKLHGNIGTTTFGTGDLKFKTGHTHLCIYQSVSIEKKKTSVTTFSSFSKESALRGTQP